MRRNVLLSVIMLLLCFTGRGLCEAPVKMAVYDRLDVVLETKKRQLFDYLERVRKNADAIRSDVYMLEFFEIKSRYYELQKTIAPPAQLTNRIATLKERIQDHYLNNYLLFYDILFISKNGDIFYTIRKEADYHKNLFEEDLAQTHLARQLREYSGETFVDYQYYTVSGEPSAFIIEPVMNGDELLGWFAMQCTVRKINAMFTREEKLGETGEVFLVNRERQMLTGSRFFGDASILERHLSRENISAKFQEKKGHRIVTDYRGQRALSSFEVCPILGTEWLLIVKIDEEEIITEHYRQDKTGLREELIRYLSKRRPRYCQQKAMSGELVRVDIDDMRKTNDTAILHTFGVSTCTAVTATYPGEFAYLAHISNYDKIYGGTETDLISHLVRRIKYYEILMSQRQNVSFVVIAKHLDSIGNIIDQLVNAGFYLSQIRFIYNPDATYANVRLDDLAEYTEVEWSLPDTDDGFRFQSVTDSDTVGEMFRQLINYE